ncbi:hypothetical protein [Pseudoalteromonas luteoviolacea]|uniref:Uncharacterized protein n=1 Tax=Pseudoalteromonas luteoviolacea S4054 TaxID=1129367 RepID=A0A0F6A8A8_9GAMM|nr:hypothetical protein [Pseudoalteromonas luteoviolacea]KKE82353.1 hypothetical protein N479_01885 [Pseudoalteromonas luteoviolacea S4054]KZN77979.1 hypothetical protein N481_03895 [Pseudoalteromonas luteoviolacea S4047-1]
MLITLKTKKLKQLSNSVVLDSSRTKQIGGAHYYSEAQKITNTITGTRPPGTSGD